MTKLYIIRGIPGSGKTTLANTMFKHGMVDAHLEADMFMVGSDGGYLFNPDLLSFAHDQCQRMTNAALQVGHKVAVSNTFIRKWEMQAYIEMAENHGAPVTVLVCQGDYENIHGVPSHKVQRMRDKFEW